MLSAGLPSQSILWGPWATGMAAADPRVGASFQRAGLSLLSPQQGLRLLQAATQHVSAAVTLAVPVRWARLCAQQRPVPAVFGEVLAAEAARQPAPPAAAAEAAQPARQALPAPQALTAAASAPVAQTSAARGAEMQQSIQTIVLGMLGRAISPDEVRQK